MYHSSHAARTTRPGNRPRVCVLAVVVSGDFNKLHMGIRLNQIPKIVAHRDPELRGHVHLAGRPPASQFPTFASRPRSCCHRLVLSLVGAVARPPVTLVSHPSRNSLRPTRTARHAQRPCLSCAVCSARSHRNSSYRRSSSTQAPARAARAALGQRVAAP